MGMSQYEPITVPAERPGMSFTKTLMGGLLVAILVAFGCAAITVLFNLQPPLVAMAAGFVIGLSVRTMAGSSSLRFGVMGALLTVFSTFLSILFSLAAAASGELGMTTLDLFWHLVTNPGLVVNVFTRSSGIIDVLTFGLAIYIGFRTAIARTQPTQSPPRVRGAS